MQPTNRHSSMATVGWRPTTARVCRTIWSRDVLHSGEDHPVPEACIFWLKMVLRMGSRAEMPKPSEMPGKQNSGQGQDRLPGVFPGQCEKKFHRT